MGDKVEVGKYRPEGTRNYIRVGDTVKVKPYKGDKFRAKVRRIVTVDGSVTEVEVWGGRKNHEALRSITPDRIERLEQTRNGERIAGVTRQASE